MTERSDVRSPAVRGPGDRAARDRPGRTTADRLDPRDRTVITVLLVSAFVVILNETIMSVALPVLMADLQVSAAVGQWLTAGFLLTMSVVIPITGFLIRRFRTRTLLRGGDGPVQHRHPARGAGARVRRCSSPRGWCRPSGTAIMMPLLMTTVMTLVPPARRGVMMGNISIVISVAPAIGPAVSGLVLSLLGWRFMFWLVLPIALGSLVVGLRRITDVGEPTRDAHRRRVGRAVGVRLRRARVRAEQLRPGDRGPVGADVGRLRRRRRSGWPRSSAGSSCCSATTAPCWTCAPSGSGPSPRPRC